MIHALQGLGLPVVELHCILGLQCTYLSRHGSYYTRDGWAL